MLENRGQLWEQRAHNADRHVIQKRELIGYALFFAIKRGQGDDGGLRGDGTQPGDLAGAAAGRAPRWMRRFALSHR